MTREDVLTIAAAVTATVRECLAPVLVTLEQRLTALEAADRRRSREDAPRSPEDVLPPREAALHILAWFEARGAIFTLTDDGHVRCDLDHMREFGGLEDAETARRVVMTLRDDIRFWLNASQQ